MSKLDIEKTIPKIVNFYLLFQKEILDLMPGSNSSDLSPLLFKTLHEINLNPEVTTSILSIRLSISLQNTSRNLQKLTELDYIKKTKDQIDKRVTHLELTEKGTALIAKSMELMDKKIADKFNCLSPTDFSALMDAFDTLNTLFKKL